MFALNHTIIDRSYSSALIVMFIRMFLKSVLRPTITLLYYCYIYFIHYKKKHIHTSTQVNTIQRDYICNATIKL